MLSNIGVSGLILGFNLIFLAIGLFIVYIVILTAVKNGINKSVVGQFIEKKYGLNEDRKSLIDSDIDNGSK